MNETIIGHRGVGKNTSSIKGLPMENTLDSMQRAYAFGFRAFETDVQLTRDGVPVLWHDDVITWDTKRRLVSDLSYNKMMSVIQSDQLHRNGEPWPSSSRRLTTLEELLEWSETHHASLVLELKVAAQQSGDTRHKTRLLRAVLRQTHQYPNVSFVLSSFDVELCDLAKRKSHAKVMLNAHTNAEIKRAPGLVRELGLDGMVINTKAAPKSLPKSVCFDVWSYNGILPYASHAIVDAFEKK